MGGRLRFGARDPRLIDGSPEQEAIWSALLDSDRHVIVRAGAGTGKTFTLVQYAMRETGKRIGLIAFNRHIANELKNRMGGQSNVECMTYHSLGVKAIQKRFGKTTLDEYKVLNILDKIDLPVERKKERNAKFKIKSLVALAKQYGAEDEAAFREIIASHSLDLNGFEDLCINYAPKVLEACRKETRTIDYDDMVWLPYTLGLPVPQFDVLCVDEYQDTNLVQQYLALKAARRLCAVGDQNQSCYFFRGADSRAFERLHETLGDNVVELPLMVTRRCPTSHVALANNIVPDLVALVDAIPGEIEIKPGMPIHAMKPGDLVLCRVNAELVSAAYQLLKSGVKAVIKGRDIGAGMLKLLEKGAVENPEDPLAGCTAITREEVMKQLALPHGRGEARAAATQDRMDCVLSLSEGISLTDDPISWMREMTAFIERLFADFDVDGIPVQAVVLSTVHKAKGLEADNVFILRPDLMPHPMARGAEDRQQEMNILYVAITRAKKKLVFCGPLPHVLGGPERADRRV